MLLRIHFFKSWYTVGFLLFWAFVISCHFFSRFAIDLFISFSNRAWSIVDWVFDLTVKESLATSYCFLLPLIFSDPNSILLTRSKWLFMVAFFWRPLEFVYTNNRIFLQFDLNCRSYLIKQHLLYNKSIGWHILKKVPNTQKIWPNLICTNVFLKHFLPLLNTSIKTGRLE